MAADPTIYALSSARGIAGVSVVRVSGPDSFAALARIITVPYTEERRLCLRTIVHPQDGRVIDRGMVVGFKGPHSFTGEDVVEFHIHGGVAVVDGLLDALSGVGLQAAEPGAFTRRAFENGRMDLTQVEGLSDLLLAQTEAQHAQAVAQMGGELKRRYEGWKQSLTHILALAEASIDFADEDLPPDMLRDASESIAEIRRNLDAMLGAGRLGEQVRDGLRVAVLGPPNAGKSSLMNVFASRDVAIVSEEPGTTRDVIEVPLNLAGVPVIFCDAAGLRETAHAVEQEGVRRARRLAAEADYRIWVQDATTGWDLAFDAIFSEYEREDDLILLNKTDLVQGDRREPERGRAVFKVSAKTGAGIDSFLNAFGSRLHEKFAAREAPLVTRERHRILLENFGEHLARAELSLGQEISLFAEDIRLALKALARLAGRVDVEDVLEIIFREFCIGK